MIKHQRTVSGYDQEELYFEKLNRELIQKMKDDTTAKRDEKTEAKQTGAQVIPFPTRTQQNQKKAA